MPGRVRQESTLADYEDSFQWIKHIRPAKGSAPILVNWALLGPGSITENGILTHSWDGGTAGFDTLHRHQEDLHFSIDSSAGVVDVEANDGAAFTEFQRRCASK